MRLLVVSTLTSIAWGGSEELWAGAALDLRAAGAEVVVLRPKWTFSHPRMQALSAAGIRLQPQLDALPPAWPARLLRRLNPARPSSAAYTALVSATRAFSPDLVLVSEAGQFDAIPWIAPCVALHLRFATLTQAVAEHEWPSGHSLDEFRATLSAAARCYFVSSGNLDFARLRLGADPPSARIVWNPFNVPFNTPPTWPTSAGSAPFRLACVARLDLASKGQDILLRALARPEWRDRPWRLSLVGAGPHDSTLRRMAVLLGIAERVDFTGHVADLSALWRTHHALVLPSRVEGMPLAAIEAMLCHRPVILTDVGGNAELIAEGASGFLAGGPGVAAIASALENAWTRRADWRELGLAAGRRIRTLIPRDPGAAFAAELRALASSP